MSKNRDICNKENLLREGATLFKTALEESLFQLLKGEKGLPTPAADKFRAWSELHIEAFNEYSVNVDLWDCYEETEAKVIVVRGSK